MMTDAGPQATEHLGLFRGGIEIRHTSPAGSGERVEKATRMIARQLGDGKVSTTGDQTLWTREGVAVELRPGADGVAIGLREDWSTLLRQAVLSGFGSGFLISVFCWILPLGLPIALLFALFGYRHVTFSQTDAVELVVKLVLVAVVFTVSLRAFRRSIVTALGYRSEELVTLTRRIATTLERDEEPPPARPPRARSRKR